MHKLFVSLSPPYLTQFDNGGNILFISALEGSELGRPVILYQWAFCIAMAPQNICQCLWTNKTSWIQDILCIQSRTILVTRYQMHFQLGCTGYSGWHMILLILLYSKARCNFFSWRYIASKRGAYIRNPKGQACPDTLCRIYSKLSPELIWFIK
jgi:hypothetical protein